MARKIRHLPGLVLLALLFYAFTQDPSSIKETVGIAFKNSKGFPKPAYLLKENQPTTQGFLLGRKLFYDPILSKDNLVSCSTCHKQNFAFADAGNNLSRGIAGQKGIRNAPALQNLIWKKAFMADGGITHLDLQPIAPLTNVVEMGETLKNVINKLQHDPVYPSLFFSSFKDSIITSEYLLKSLTQFLCAVISTDSHYDRYISGREQFTEQELSGLKIFRSHCENCHKEPLFTDYSYRNIGLQPDSILQDAGRAGITGLQEDSNKFMVPSLRNVEVTAPYMHDGRFNKLEEVINHYAEGNFATANIDSSIVRNMGLSEKEKKALIVFLQTLTDQALLHDSRFSNPGSSSNRN